MPAPIISIYKTLRLRLAGWDWDELIKFGVGEAVVAKAKAVEAGDVHTLNSNIRLRYMTRKARLEKLTKN